MELRMVFRSLYRPGPGSGSGRIKRTLWEKRRRKEKKERKKEKREKKEERREGKELAPQGH